ncbi:hypothetical protein SUDANB121_03200 [Nocardiopsis dassonvillei]|uniref:hypothetical protein n=1 Tax=Nocardiopsis dassonvillei TaxID=2014 RepID=UPI003F57F9E5
MRVKPTLLLTAALAAAFFGASPAFAAEPAPAPAVVAPFSDDPADGGGPAEEVPSPDPNEGGGPAEEVPSPAPGEPTEEPTPAPDPDTPAEAVPATPIEENPSYTG